MAKRKRATLAEQRLKATEEENARLQERLQEKQEEYDKLNKAFDTQAQTLRNAHIALTENGVSHGTNDLVARIRELAKDGGLTLRVKMTELVEKLTLVDKRLSVVDEELKRQKGLTMEGHRQYEIMKQDRDAIARLRDRYEDTIQVLAALLAAKPRQQTMMLGLDWGLGKDRSVFQIPIELVEASGLRAVREEATEGLRREAGNGARKVPVAAAEGESRPSP